MKKRITIYLDEDVLDAFRHRAAEEGAGYQTMINKALKEHLERKESAPKKRSLAEALLAMPDVGRDEDFERIQDDDERSGDVFD
jgi:hypothetical protein